MFAGLTIILILIYLFILFIISIIILLKTYMYAPSLTIFLRFKLHLNMGSFQILFCLSA